jgi:hypothetical protein
LKVTLIILIHLIATYSYCQTAPVDNIGVKGSFKFNDTNFTLSWSSRVNENYYVQEYLPKGEKLDSFKNMITINVFRKKNL